MFKILELYAKNEVCEGWNFWEWQMGSLQEKNIRITFLTDAPFIVKFRFEKYRYLLTHLLCLQIFEVLLSDKHSTGPRNGRLVPLPVACLVWWYSFRPQIYDESETDQILNAKYFVWKNYTLGKWGLREAFNQNSLMQVFNGDRRIVQWLTQSVSRSPIELSRTVKKNKGNWTFWKELKLLHFVVFSKILPNQSGHWQSGEPRFGMKSGALHAVWKLLNPDRPPQ